MRNIPECHSLASKHIIIGTLALNKQMKYKSCVIDNLDMPLPYGICRQYKVQMPPSLTHTLKNISLDLAKHYRGCS
jgi:hypothetical protein